MPGCIYHVMHAAADITFSLLTSEFVLSPSLFFPWIQFVLSLQIVPRVRLLLDRLWLSTVCDVSSSTHHVINPSRPSPAFRIASDKSWAWRPENEASCRLHPGMSKLCHITLCEAMYSFKPSLGFISGFPSIISYISITGASSACRPVLTSPLEVQLKSSFCVVK